MIDGWRLYNWLCDWQYADFVDLQNGTKGREKENAVLEEVIQMVLEMIKEGE